MRILLVPANSNDEWPHKEEFMRLGAVVWPDKKSYRWDKSEPTLRNFLWFLKFETDYSNKSAELKRQEIKVIS